jgi:hypothetical protein
MQRLEKIKILFIAGFGPIVRDTAASRKLYAEALEIPFKEESGGYLHTDSLQGAKEFALWPLSEVAKSCFGNSAWTHSLPAPHAWLEFDVDNVESATARGGEEVCHFGGQKGGSRVVTPWLATVAAPGGELGIRTGCPLKA